MRLYGIKLKLMLLVKGPIVFRVGNLGSLDIKVGGTPTKSTEHCRACWKKQVNLFSVHCLTFY